MAQSRGYRILSVEAKDLYADMNMVEQNDIG